MIVVGTCFAGDGTRYRECAEPTLEQFRAAGDVVLAASGDRRGIAAVYNEFIDAARARLDCEALVLVQDDVEILDAQARAKILTAVASDTVGLVGVVGARDVRSLAWWEGVGVGAVLESRGPITHEEREGIVDAVDGLDDAVHGALAYDTRVIVEEGLEQRRELEVGVLEQDGRLEVSCVGEIVPANRFYDFDAKYLAPSTLMVPAGIDPATAEAIDVVARRAFAAIQGRGMARIDLFLAADGRLLLNEINTIPGFTEASMFPRVWAASGVDLEALVERLLAAART
jgi:hypothetical protein